MSNLIEIESKDFLYVRQEIQRLADSLVNEQTSSEEEREQSKTEMEQASINVTTPFGVGEGGVCS